MTNIFHIRNYCVSILSFKNDTIHHKAEVFPAATHEDAVEIANGIAELHFPASEGWVDTHVSFNDFGVDRREFCYTNVSHEYFRKLKAFD